MGDRRGDAVAYLPASLVRAFGAQPSLGVPFAHRVDGTMVMADLSGFTAMSEQLARLGDEGAERLVQIINGFFERMLKAASRHGGDVLTFGGDAILLLFEGQDHAARAVAASLAMLRQVERAAVVEAGGSRIKVGMSVGAHSDEFLLAGAGTAEEGAQVFFLGRGAEETARAEARAEQGQLAVSTATKTLLAKRAKLKRSGDFWLVAGWDGGESREQQVGRHAALTDDVLSRATPFLPPYARGGSDAGEGLLRLTPEHRRVAVVFVNILGLNELIDLAGPEAALGQLQTYAAMLTRLCQKHRGFIVSSDIATAGCKLVLTFGAPVAHEYAATNAARFALELNGELRDLRLDIRHRIGVNGGHVFAGEVGPALRRQYTCMGDAVNLAARLMAAAAPGEVYASRDLLARAAPSLCGRELRPLKVKGKEQPVAACVLEEETGPSRHVHEWTGPGAATGRLFGRRAELDLISSRWREARQDAAGRALLVEGEAGVGKTRLVEEALREFDQEGERRPDRILRAACFEHLQAAPFTPWVAVLQALFGIERGETTERSTRRVRDHLGERLPDLVEFAPLLNPLLAVTLPGNDVVGSLDARTRRAKLFELVAELLGQAAGERGLLLVIEDVHWMDESSQSLVGHLADHGVRAPLLVLLTTRPPEMPETTDGGVERLVLNELSRDESLTMLRDALGVADLPSEVGDALYEKTRGNPLFLEEVVHSLRAPGVLDRILSSSSVTRAADLAALEIPDRVQGLLMSRVDQLAPDTREVLKAGAVAGRSFDEGVLAGMADPLLQGVSLHHAFDELIAAALVVPRAADGGVTFRHALVQDVTYESLPFSRRRRLHGAVAGYLEALPSPPDHAVLVHHYRLAGDTAKTRLHAILAAASSVAVYANLEAIDYLAVALATTRARTAGAAALRSRLEELMGDSMVTLFRHREAIRCFASARRRWASTGVRRASLEALAGLGPVDDPEARESLLCWKLAVSLERGLSQYGRALRWLQKGEEALPPGRNGLEARLLATKGGILSWLGRFREAAGVGEDGLGLARRDGDPALLAYALYVLANAYAGLGMLDRAKECDEESVALYEQAGDLAGLARAHVNLASSYFLKGDFREALSHSEVALALHSRVGNIRGVASQHHNVAGVLLQLGEVDTALEHLEEALRLRGHEVVDPQVAGFALVLLCKARVWSGDLEGAEQALNESLEILKDGDAGDLLDAGIIEAELRLEQGDPLRAESAGRRVLGLARSMEAELNEAQALCMLGRAQFAAGDPEGAVPDLQASLELAQRIGAEYERGQALAALAEALAACAGADPECEDLLGQAISLFKKMGARYDLEKSLELRRRLALEASVEGESSEASS